MKKEKEKLKVERVKVSSEVEWKTAREGIEQLRQLLDAEIVTLDNNAQIRNAYSPITWSKLCRYINHATEGMMAVRLATEGKTTPEIAAITGMPTTRIAAFKAWNTIWKKAIDKFLTIKWRKQEERRADIEFLRAIGIKVEDESEVNA
jgi:hypothetical protein